MPHGHDSDVDLGRAQQHQASAHGAGLGVAQDVRPDSQDNPARPTTPATLAYLAAVHAALDWAPDAVVPRKQSIKVGKVMGASSAHSV